MQTISKYYPIADKELMGLIPQTESVDMLFGFACDVEERARVIINALGDCFKLKNDEHCATHGQQDRRKGKDCGCDWSEEWQETFVAFNTRADEIDSMAAALVAAVDARANEQPECPLS